MMSKKFPSGYFNCPCYNLICYPGYFPLELIPKNCYNYIQICSCYRPPYFPGELPLDLRTKKYSNSLLKLLVNKFIYNKIELTPGLTLKDFPIIPV